MKDGRNKDGKYSFSFEVSGQLACFTAPDAFPCNVTYPFATLSACEGWIKHIAYQKSARAVVEKLEICSALHYESFDFLNSSYGRYAGNVTKGSCDVIKRTCLRDVCYKVFGYTESDLRYPQKGVNNRHAYQCMLLRGIKRGLSKHPIYLGTSDFPVNYFGELREDTQPLHTFNITIPRMLVRTFDTFKHGEQKAKFATVTAKNGIVIYEDTHANVG